MRDTRIFCSSLGASCSAAATAVATSVRKAITFPYFTCTALVSRITYVFVVGSIHNEVPVNPVCPNEPTGNRSPRLEENGESMSHPNPRTMVRLGGCCGVVIFSTIHGDNMGAPPLSIA